MASDSVICTISLCWSYSAALPYYAGLPRSNGFEMFWGLTSLKVERRIYCRTKTWNASQFSQKVWQTWNALDGMPLLLNLECQTSLLENGQHSLAFQVSVRRPAIHAYFWWHCQVLNHGNVFHCQVRMIFHSKVRFPRWIYWFYSRKYCQVFSPEQQWQKFWWRKKQMRIILFAKRSDTSFSTGILSSCLHKRVWRSPSTPPAEAKNHSTILNCMDNLKFIWYWSYWVLA